MCTFPSLLFSLHGKRALSCVRRLLRETARAKRRARKRKRVVAYKRGEGGIDAAFYRATASHGATSGSFPNSFPSSITLSCPYLSLSPTSFSPFFSARLIKLGVQCWLFPLFSFSATRITLIFATRPLSHPRDVQATAQSIRGLRHEREISDEDGRENFNSIVKDDGWSEHSIDDGITFISRFLFSIFHLSSFFRAVWFMSVYSYFLSLLYCWDFIYKRKEIKSRPVLRTDVNK